jgi:hypothetical protein
VSRDAYRIEDEPSPGALAPWAVNPLWPLLAMMFVGTWFGLAWFAFNGLAVGSPTLRREWALMAGGLAGAFAIVVGLGAAAGTGLLARGMPIEFALLGLVVWKLALGYWLNVLQGATIEIHEYYGGTLRNGLPVVFAATFFLRKPVLDALPALWRTVLQ